jgi:ribosome-associated protein
VRLDAEGRVIVTCEQYRTREQNLAEARDKLARLVRRALEVPRPRRPTRPTAGSKRRRLEAKRHQSTRKRERQTSDD